MRKITMFMAITILGLSGCTGLPGLTLGQGQVIKGKIAGKSVTSATKVAIVFDTPFPDEFDKAQVVSLGSDGSFSYAIPVGKTNVTLFAFQDTNGNSKVDSTEATSFKLTSCTSCSYVQATQIGDTWKINVVKSGPSASADTSSANIQFDAA